MNHHQRVELAKRALVGISIGDAFGDSFFGDTDKITGYIDERRIPPTKWEFTDDTVMAIAVFEQLERHANINQDELARYFALNHEKDINRGYGATARRILREIQAGSDWRKISKEAFDGMGSMGNGASMRVGPIGAYHFDDLDKVKELSALSAEITHANLEGKTGAIAIGLATAIATKLSVKNIQISPHHFIEEIATYLPDTDVKSKILKSRSVSYNYHIETVRTILGNGTAISAQDTIPFCLWCASYNLVNFEEGIWKAISALGDRDTICAIVGGILIMSAKPETIPGEWLRNTEDFEKSIFRNKVADKEME